MQAGSGFPRICNQKETRMGGIPVKTNTAEAFQCGLIDILSVMFNTSQTYFSIIIGVSAEL